MTRLSLSTLSSLSEGIHAPKYNPADHKAGIVHLGVGAFHRTHQAWYTHKVLEEFGGDWRIIGVSLRSPGVRDTMVPQDCLYTVAVKGDKGQDYHIMGSISQMLVAPENPTAVIDVLASEDTKVVTLTITEKGYSLNNSTGKLELDNADIAHDLSNLSSPKTAIGYLAASLKKRMETGAGNVTIISCDNLAGNGAKLKVAVEEFAQAVSADLASWIAEHVTFPATMVDRIAPATLDQDRASVAQATGLEDQACVVTEPFAQWVIEENFAGPVPPWNKVGADYVKDVEPFEDMKLRMLNASHSSIAYLGCLAGYETVSQTISDPAFKNFVDQMMNEELIPTLSIPDGFDVKAYAASLLERFSNGGLPHKTRQIAMDGSQKIPQRALPALTWLLDNNGSIDRLSLCVAAWVRYTKGVEENGDVYVVDDPMAAEFKAIAGLDGKAHLDALLNLEGIFPDEIKQNERFVEKLLFWQGELSAKGALKTMQDHFGS